MPEFREHISCQELVELTSDYIENALSAEDAELLEQHLNYCAGCERYVDEMLRTIRAEGILREEKVPRRRPSHRSSRPLGSGGSRDRLQVPARRRHEPLLAAFRWDLPDTKPGGWVEARVDPCRGGPHACRPGDLPFWPSDSLYEIEVDGEISEGGSKLVASRGRLLRRIDAWDDELRGAFARRAPSEPTSLPSAPPLPSRTRLLRMAELDRSGRRPDRLRNGEDRRGGLGTGWTPHRARSPGCVARRAARARGLIAPGGRPPGPPMTAGP